MSENTELLAKAGRANGEVQQLRAVHEDSRRDLQRSIEILQREARDLRQEITRLEK